MEDLLLYRGKNMSSNQKRPYVRVSFDGIKSPLSLEEFRAITGERWKVTEAKWRALSVSKASGNLLPGFEIRLRDLGLLVEARQLLQQHQSSVRVLVDGLEQMTFADFQAALGGGWKRTKAEWRLLRTQLAQEGLDPALHTRLVKLQWFAQVRQHLRRLAREEREAREDLLSRTIRKPQ
jgi:hypothetical protein